ncbi:putative dual specificity protein [Vigna angularis]|uniref:Putative dual specificity protein n=1 Tax=Phaseolus angularis TaxID=3914 RepID=A0A8T0LE15_PHAAN|nr:putative dual specificity protein [Vigna angularis]
MKIEELDDAECSIDEQEKYEKQMVSVEVKRALVGAGARILFYPTLLYNVLRNKIEAEFRWWDQIDEFLLLGAVPFPKDVPLLKSLGVGGVITLNEPYETLVPSSLYRAHGIDHLVIPTRDYLFAPSIVDINQAVQFIHRGCFLVEYKHMTPAAALEYVRSRRPRVLLAPSQWKAVQNYNNRRPCPLPYSPSGDAVLITKADLEGYHSTCDAGMELAIVPKLPRTMPMIARLSCLFASLKVSGSSVPMIRRLPVSESRAC